MSFSTGKAIERSVDSLQEIYAVIIALAIAQAIQSLLKEPTEATGVSLHRLSAGWPAFIAFLVTLVPFWHGMNRHLDRCYLEKAAADVVEGALILDFVTFFLEACCLFAAGWSLRFGIDTFFCLGALLVIDMVWAFISHQIHFRGKKSHAVTWASVNLVAIGIAFFVITYQFEPKPLVLMVVAVLRSIADYWFCRKFYFPSGSAVRA